MTFHGVVKLFGPQRIDPSSREEFGTFGGWGPQTGKEDLVTNVSHPRFFQRLQSVFVITNALAVRTHHVEAY